MWPGEQLGGWHGGEHLPAPSMVSGLVRQLAAPWTEVDMRVMGGEMGGTVHSAIDTLVNWDREDDVVFREAQRFGEADEVLL